jgi:hypothetical protein
MLVRENQFVRFQFKAPFLYMTILKDTAPSDDDWAFAEKTLFDFYTAAEQTNTRLAIRMDLQKLAILPLSRWKQLNATLDSQRHRTINCVYGVCMVNNSSIIRMAVNGMFKLCPPARPIHFVSGHADADNWLEQMIAQQDVADGRTTRTIKNEATPSTNPAATASGV